MTAAVNTTNSNSNPSSSSSTWSPALVEDLIFRQFLKGEDISSEVPAKVEEQKLPEQDPCVRAFFKYVDNMGPAPVSRQQVQQQQQQNGTPLRPPQQHQQAAAIKGAHGAPMLANPPPGTPRGGGGPGSKSMSRTPRAGGGNNDGGGNSANNSNNNGNMPAPHHDAMRRRRVEWPSGVPTDAQLRGAQRGALQPLAERRVVAQSEVDPDLIFRQDNAEFPLNRIFGQYPQALKLISQTRGLSGDWRTDTFKAEEEAEYKASMGFTVLGSSQAQPAAVPVKQLF